MKFIQTTWSKLMEKVGLTASELSRFERGYEFAKGLEEDKLRNFVRGSGLDGTFDDFDRGILKELEDRKQVEK
jgi:inorganic triphosphatase YgiF